MKFFIIIGFLSLGGCAANVNVYPETKCVEITQFGKTQRYCDVSEIEFSSKQDSTIDKQRKLDDAKGTGNY